MVDSLQVWTARICETSLNMAENTRIYRRIMLKYSTELMFTYWNTLELLAKSLAEAARQVKKHDLHQPSEMQNIFLLMPLL